MLNATRTLQIALERAAPPLSPRAPSLPPVVINICRHCNMRCPHCFIASGSRRSPRDLDLEQGLALLATLAAGGVRDVIFSGGEPLVREDLPRLVAGAASRGLRAHLSSNGVLLGRQTAAALRRLGLRSVTVSVDGPPALHDAYRGMPGAFERALQGLQAAAGEGLFTGLRMTLTRHNAAHAEWLHQLAVTHGIGRFLLMHLVPAERKHAALRAPAARGVLLRLFALAEQQLPPGGATELVSESNDSDRALLLHWIEERHGPATAQRAADHLRSPAARRPDPLCVDSRGQLYPEPFWRKEQLGDLRRQTLEQALAHPLWQALPEREQRLQGRCGRCAARAICRGGHRGRAQLLTGELWGADPDCLLEEAELTRAW